MKAIVAEAAGFVGRVPVRRLLAGALPMRTIEGAVDVVFHFASMPAETAQLDYELDRRVTWTRR